MTATLHLPPALEGRHLPALRRALFEALRNDPHLAVDGSHVRVLSLAGQAVLLSTGRAARRRGGDLLVDSPSDAMTAALRATGLRHLLDPPSTGQQRQSSLAE